MKFTRDELEELDPSERFERSDASCASEVIGRLGPSVETSEANSRSDERLERILEKISRTGMRSLTFRERWTLKRSTRRRRDSSS